MINCLAKGIYIIILYTEKIKKKLIIRNYYFNYLISLSFLISGHRATNSRIQKHKPIRLVKGNNGQSESHWIRQNPIIKNSPQTMVFITSSLSFSLNRKRICLHTLDSYHQDRMAGF